jgi:hypothetical protein
MRCWDRVRWMRGEQRWIGGDDDLVWMALSLLLLSLLIAVGEGRGQLQKRYVRERATGVEVMATYVFAATDLGSSSPTPTVTAIAEQTEIGLVNSVVIWSYVAPTSRGLHPHTHPHLHPTLLLVLLLLLLLLTVHPALRVWLAIDAHSATALVGAEAWATVTMTMTKWVLKVAWLFGVVLMVELVV